MLMNTIDGTFSPARRLTLAVLALALFCCTSCQRLQPATADQSAPGADDDNRQAKMDAERTKFEAELAARKARLRELGNRVWELVDFPNDRQIRKIRLLFHGRDAKSAPLLDVESSEPIVLERVTRALDYLPSRWPFPTIGFRDEGVAFAELRIYTTKDDFIISLHELGRDGVFALGSQIAGPQNSFHSWTLAKVVDDLYLQATDRHLPIERFEFLSGEHRLKAEMESYEEHEMRSEFNFLEKRRDALKAEKQKSQQN
jgi:hypothetical protein